MIDKTQECADVLAFRMYRNGEWRESKAERFSDDPRNARASSLLKDLAGQCTRIPAAQWEKIAPYFDPNGKKWLDAVSATCRDVCFRSDVRDLDGYLDELIVNLSKPSRH